MKSRDHRFLTRIWTKRYSHIRVWNRAIPWTTMRSSTIWKTFNCTPKTLTRASSRFTRETITQTTSVMWVHTRKLWMTRLVTSPRWFHRRHGCQRSQGRAVRSSLRIGLVPAGNHRNRSSDHYPDKKNWLTTQKDSISCNPNHRWNRPRWSKGLPRLLSRT